ncbi:TLR adapter interacting with SLC15A4 on the lysosome [Spea bombifrons]|uniref:TLR adapter interacting with SLC15A4 on the lysosome n=1 Tax=Spea bombifrons TaxID=233779 RepID=UPI0023498AC6|nr:TLR adapter interacting with SLC15A4 on the lysosome [Spea bombifrons]
MLSEGYLCRIQQFYEDDIMSHQRRMTGSSKELTAVSEHNYSSVHKTRTRNFFRKFGSIGKNPSGTQHTDGTQSKMSRNMHQEIENVRDTSTSVDIIEVSASYKETFLVPSSCKNICKDYNDLHVAGDQVMAINSVLTDYTCNSSFTFCEGPFLESSQIPPTLESINPEKIQRKKDSLCWKAGSIRDKSIMQHEQPLSNSVLNEYLERKVIELYKQYIMDCTASPHHIMASELVMNNVQQISVQISREQNMETNKAKDMVINYLLRLASEKTSNVISTPDLKISID